MGKPEANSLEFKACALFKAKQGENKCYFDTHTQKKTLHVFALEVPLKLTCV